MFLRRNRRKVNGESYEYWTLVRTVRTAKGPRQEVVASLGKTPGLDERSRHGWDDIADLLEGHAAGPRQGQWGQSLSEEPLSQWAQVDLRGVSVERVRGDGGNLKSEIWSRDGSDGSGGSDGSD
ncbi:MAG TPA: hypothetical protein VGY56_05225 [Verrucomicrobiae bacterium]|nr:hypothetical protein [Verrucomicrobiae bacterium]